MHLFTPHPILYPRVHLSPVAPFIYLPDWSADAIRTQLNVPEVDQSVMFRQFATISVLGYEKYFEKLFERRSMKIFPATFDVLAEEQQTCIISFLSHLLLVS